MAGAAATLGDQAPIADVGPARRRYILILLLAAYTLSYLDRQVLSILVEPIERELKVSDAYMGLLTGPIFVIFYCFLGVPIARISDRRSRPLVIAVSLTLWSGFTMLSGFASSFAVLALARLGVGFGEAGCNPAAHSLIADISKPSERASGLAFYSLGISLGSLLGLALGGVLADAFGWRASFMLCGAPGIALAVVFLLTVRDPRVRAAASAAPAGPTLTQALRDLAGKPSFWLVSVATGLVALVGYGQTAFIAAFFLRAHAHAIAIDAAAVGLKSEGFVGLVLGVIGGAAGLTGTLIGGWLADRFGGRDRRALVTVPALATIVSLPFRVALFMAADPATALVLLVITNVLGAFWYGPCFATIQSVTAPHTRATAASISQLILNLIGLGLGPTLVGVLSTYLAVNAHLGRIEGLRWSMIASTFVGLFAVALFLLARRTIRRDLVS
ncbi:MAG TPA: MFS transporter [Caulobacteraceae bacterium]|jgi:predicted MFS family arabinose efflux permease|nr:MFS transporter [Caulobacteraceae bacterium]